MLIYRAKITPDQPPLGSVLYQLAKGVDEIGLGEAELGVITTIIRDIFGFSHGLGVWF